MTSTLCDVEAAFVEAADDVAEALYRERCEAFLQYFYRQPCTANPASELVQVRRNGMNRG